MKTTSWTMKFDGRVYGNIDPLILCYFYECLFWLYFHFYFHFYFSFTLHQVDCLFNAKNIYTGISSMEQLIRKGTDQYESHNVFLH